MNIQEYIEFKKQQGEYPFNFKVTAVPTKPKTQIEYVIEAIEQFNISMLEVVLDYKNTYNVIIDNICLSNTKKEFIDFLNHNFEDLKKKHIKKILSSKISDDNDVYVSVSFDCFFDFEPDFNSIGVDMLDDSEPYYNFFMDIYFDKNKNVTGISFSNEL